MGLKSVLLTVALAAGLLVPPVQAKEEISPAAISAMVEKVKIGDPTADVTWLRRENSRRMSYMAPRWEEAGKAFDTFETDPAKALLMAEKQLLANPLDIDANFLAEISYSKLDRVNDEERQHTFLMAILQSVMDGQDGKTPKTAWNAVSVDEEYQILRLIGYQPSKQALISDNGNSYDAMTVTDNKSGKEWTIHFNIDFFFGKQFEGLLN